MSRGFETSHKEYAAMEALEQLRFLQPAEVEQIAARWGPPVFVYDVATLEEQARAALAFQAPFGLTVRYAMKANPNAAVLRVLHSLGIAIDASSGYEAERAQRAGVNAENILITAQELPINLESMVQRGAHFNACSLHQLETYGRLFPGTEVSVRINPGVGSGHSHKTDVGGPASSFGIWHESLDQIKAIAARYELTIRRLHTHIGSGTDPLVWRKVARLSLNQVCVFPDVTILNLGGGFKVARMASEEATDLREVSEVIAATLETFAKETGRKLHLEIEPGTYLTANAGSLITRIDDIVETGSAGYKFLKVNSGMTDLLRPTLYAAQHPLVVMKEAPVAFEKYVVVGHCCESSDLLTPHPDDSEAVFTRTLPMAEIGDLLVVEGVGAYCASMSAHNYNSFPRTPELLRRVDGTVEEVTER